MANKMAEVAKLLGVELDEEFEVEDFYCGENNRSTCRLTGKGVEVLCRSIGCDDNIIEKWARNSRMLDGLLCGEDRFNIVRKQWRPRNNEIYWTYDSFQRKFISYKTMWVDTVLDYTRAKCGMVFRTEEEAIAARPRIYKELTGHDWEDDTT